MEPTTQPTEMATEYPRRQAIKAFALVAATTAAASCGTASNEPPTQDGAAEAGAPSLGDDYTPSAGNGGYDVSSYVIDNRVELDPPRIATGKTTITATAGQNLSRFSLDFSLAVNSVMVNGQKAEFYTTETKLVITPSSVIPRGSTFITVVVYHSGDRPDGWYVAGDEILATGEPEIAQWWFPSNDHPRDAARFDVTLDVPAERVGVSVGRLTDRRDEDGRSIWHWVGAEPMATYVSFFSVGDFDISQDIVDGVRYHYFVSQRLSEQQRRTNMEMLRRTPQYVAALSRDFGTYPYADGGGLVTSTFDTDNEAMENQTRPTYPAMDDDLAGRRLIVHEVAHQWFGDDVRLDRWRDIILNEAFARWAELRWMETGEGIPANRSLTSLYDKYPARDRFWELVLDDPGADHLLDDPIYDRGGMMVQALRNRVGEDAFFTILKNWISQIGGKTARVADFERLACDTSGQDLSDFFRVWLRDQSKPARTAANGLSV